MRTNQQGTLGQGNPGSQKKKQEIKPKEEPAKGTSLAEDTQKNKELADQTKEAGDAEFTRRIGKKHDELGREEREEVEEEEDLYDYEQDDEIDEDATDADTKRHQDLGGVL
jgi:hypothetical protein